MTIKIRINRRTNNNFAELFSQSNENQTLMGIKIKDNEELIRVY